MERVLERELTHGRDDLFYYDGRPFTGTAYTLAPGGWVQSESEYADGSRDGIARGWFGPGRLECEAEFAGGLLHGVRRCWHESGRVDSEELFEHGIRLWGKAWDEAGNQTEDFRLSESDPDYAILLVQRRAYERWKEGKRGDSRK